VKQGPDQNRRYSARLRLFVGAISAACGEAIAKRVQQRMIDYQQIGEIRFDYFDLLPVG
jgi:hypothetical protein